MPYQKDVDERHYYWCPKWYWPFAVCSHIVRVHKWCYNFAWVRETGYGVFSHLEGCENGTLYTWDEPSLNFFASHDYAGGERCFDSPRSSEGRCDPSRTGLQASGLSPSAPFVSNVADDIEELSSRVVETGSYEFTPDDHILCQEGVWPWKRTLHEQVITASVTTRFVAIQWYIGGIPVVSNAGTLSTSASCSWPFPLPKGRSENRVVQVTYEVITEANKSTLKVFNNPVDGSYSFSIGMSALEDGKEYISASVFESFSGETCDFDPEQLEERKKCIARYQAINQGYAKSKTPNLGEPVVIFSEEIWRSVREERRGTVNALLEILANTYQHDPETFTRAMNQLEQEIGLVGISRLITVGAVEKAQKIVLQR